MKKKLMVLGLIVALVAIPLAACAQPAPAPTVAMPDRVTIVFTYGTGGGSDKISRAIMPYFKKYSGASSVVTESRPGATGTIGSNYVYGQPADGSIVLFAANVILQAPLIYDYEMAYSPKHPLEAFIPVCQITIPGPEGLLSAKSSPIKTFADFISVAKSGEGALVFGGGGMGSTESIFILMMEKRENIKFTYVPYEGGGEQHAAARGGHVDVTLSDFSRILADPDSFNILAFMNVDNRLEEFPDVPTFKELGYGEMTAGLNYGFFLKEGTPPEIVSWYADALKKTTSDPEFLEWAEGAGRLVEYQDGATYANILSDWEKSRLDILPAVKQALKEAQK